MNSGVLNLFGADPTGFSKPVGSFAHAKDAQGVFLRPRREDVQVGEDEETLVPAYFFT